MKGSEMLAESASVGMTSQFCSKTQIGFSTIVLSINAAQLYLVASYDKPKQAWDALENRYERETLANQLFLKKQYFRMGIKEDSSMEQHLKSMKNLTDILTAIGAPFSEEDTVVTLFIRKLTEKLCDTCHRF